MSEELTKEMEELEDEIEEATAKPTGVSAKEPGASNPSSVKLKQEKENMEKTKTPGKASDPKSTKGIVKPVIHAEDAEEEEEEEVKAKSESDEEEEEVKKEEKSTPKLKSEIMQGLVDHIKGLKKEDLAKLYGTHVLGETEQDEGYEEEEEDEEASKVKKEDIEQVVDALDVSGDVEALVDGEELSEEFKTKAATIFEAAVKSKIAKIRKQIREENKKEQNERIASIQEEMTDNIDKYLSYATKEWMEENKLSVETGVRNEVTESFIKGLKKLFEEHYIDVPEEKEDVFESLVVEVAELEEKLDTQTQKHMDTVKELNTYKAASIFQTVAEGMVDTDVEKFKELIEDVDYDADEQYAEKLNTIKNSYFKSDKKDEVVDNKKSAGTNNPVVDGNSDARMDSVMQAISSLSKK